MKTHTPIHPGEVLREGMPALLACMTSLENLLPQQEITAEQLLAMTEAEQTAWLKLHGKTAEEMADELLPTK